MACCPTPSKCIGSGFTIFLLASALFICYATVLHPRREPRISLVSARLTGVAAHVSPPPAVSLRLNVTLLLVLGLQNPNRASFAYGGGAEAKLTYRDASVGEAGVGQGHVPGHGNGEVSVALTVRHHRQSVDLPRLIADIVCGAVQMDATIRIPGRLTHLRSDISRRRAVVASSVCYFVLDLTEMKVRMRSQRCDNQTHFHL